MATTLTLMTPDSGGSSSLVERAQHGDVDAFEALYRLHAARVYALCLRLTGNANAARALTQDVFVRAWQALPAFRGDATMTTWLHSIAVNEQRMERRADRRRQARVSLVDDEDSGASTALQGETPPVDVATTIDLERAIASLPPGARQAFVLHAVHGYTHDEIAGMTGLAAGTLRAQLHRARQLLIKALGT